MVKVGSIIECSSELFLVVFSENKKNLVARVATEETINHDSSKIEVVTLEGNLNQVFYVYNEIYSINLEQHQVGRVVACINPEQLNLIVRQLGKVLANVHYKIAHQTTEYETGNRISYAGKVYGPEEIHASIEASLDFWLTSGRFTEKFEKMFCKLMKVRSTHLVNSGSSANLLAISALTSPILKEKRLLPGDEVITVAAGFPTTIAPIIQNKLVPVFLDIQIPNYNIDTTQLAAALTNRTRAVMLAHTLGNPFNVEEVVKFCANNKLFLIEDNCDALGSTISYDGQERLTGTFGNIATSSFYPPHHITMGEGGAVYTNDPKISKAVASFRDWGRDCWCPSGNDNTCGKRFVWDLGTLPSGYDHKYIYSHFGYNLKATDIQAAIGCVQLDKLFLFKQARIRNWNLLREVFSKYEDFFILPEPTPRASPSWFGFIVSLRDQAKFRRGAVVKFLEDNNIQTRMLFSGNILRQPCMQNFSDPASTYRVLGDLNNSDFAMNNAFILGVYPGIGDRQIQYVDDILKKYFSNHTYW